MESCVGVLYESWSWSWSWSWNPRWSWETLQRRVQKWLAMARHLWRLQRRQTGSS